MANVLFLVHRLPFPPNKGDKVRSYHLLKHLAAKHKVFLGTFVDDPDDIQHIETVRGFCCDLYVAHLNPKFAKIRSLNGLLAGDPLTLRYYRDARLQDWVDQTCKQVKIDAAVVFCSAMAQYIESIPRLPKVIDFVDVDSAKWTQYASNHRWPMSWLYRREGEFLLAYERSIASSSTRSFFVTEAEVALFTRIAPECAIRVEAICNGVDADYFAPDPARANPYSAEEIPLVFTGAMDYLPNVDAVRWFVADMLPTPARTLASTSLLYCWPQPQHQRFRHWLTPTSQLPAQCLMYALICSMPQSSLHHCALPAASRTRSLKPWPWRGRVIASTECAAAVDAVFGQELLTATTPADFITKIDQLLQDTERCTTIGQAAREKILSCYSWEAHLGGMDKYLTAA